MPVTHSYTSPVADESGGVRVKPQSHWNAPHVANIDLATEVTGILDASHLPSLSGTYINVAGTSTTTASIPFAQGINITGGAINLQMPNANIYNLTRTIPTTISDAVSIGSFVLTNGAGNFEIWLNVPSSGYAQSKRYFIPAYYNGTAGAWQKVCAAANTGPYNNSGALQDVDLEINSNNATTSLRLRRVAGTVAGTAQIMIIHEGTITDAFTPSTSSSSVLTITDTYRIFADQLQILSTPGDLGSYSLSSWNGTSVPVPAFLKSPSVSGTSGGAGISATEPALILGRSGIASTTYPNFAEFKIGRYENSGAASRTQLDIALTHGNGDAAGTNVLSLRSNGFIGSGTNAPAAKLHLNLDDSTVPTILFTGVARDGSSDTTGGAIILTHNGGSNCQIAFGRTVDGVGVRFLGNALDAYNYITSGRLDLQIGTDTSGVTIGNALASGSTQLCTVYTSTATRIGFVVQGFTSQSADLTQWQNISATVLGKVNASGVQTMPNFVSSVATGTQPYATTSTTVNTNLNAQIWNGLTNSFTAPANYNLVYYDGSKVVNLANPSKFSYYLTFSAGVMQWTVQAATATPSWTNTLAVGRTSAGVNPQLTTTDRLEIRANTDYLGSTGAGIIDLVGSGVINLTPATSLTIAKLVSSYAGVTTAGWGFPTIYGNGRSVAQTAAVASVATYTLAAADGSFEVSANVLVTTATLHSFTVTVSYTDEGNTARTVTMQLSTLAGAFVTAITNAQGTVPYEGVPLHLRCKASTAITVATTGTFTTVTYNVEGNIRQLA